MPRDSAKRDDKRIKQLWDEGLTVRQISAEVHWCATTVRERLKEQGVVFSGPGYGRRERMIDEDELFLTVELYVDRGLTGSQIAAVLPGITPSGVYSRLEDNNVPTRVGWACRTRCANGHEFTPDNTRYNPARPTVRICMQCQRDASKRWRDRRSASRAPSGC